MTLTLQKAGAAIATHVAQGTRLPTERSLDKLISKQVDALESTGLDCREIRSKILNSTLNALPSTTLSPAQQSALASKLENLLHAPVVDATSFVEAMSQSPSDTKFRGSLTVLGKKVQSHLTDALRKKKYQGNPNPMAGHCYVSAEALYHLAGGKDAGFTPMTVRHEDDTHWFVRHNQGGFYIDLTASQFETPVPVDVARGAGFLTKQPSKRAQVVIDSVLSDLRLNPDPKAIAALSPEYQAQLG